MFIAVKTPLALALTIISFSLALSLRIAQFYSSWVALALILIFLGGIIVIFLYFCSLSINDKPVFTPPKSGLVLLIIITTLHPVSDVYGVNFIKLNFESFNLSSILILVSYLLTCLFIVVKFSENFKGALRIKFF